MKKSKSDLSKKPRKKTEKPFYIELYLSLIVWWKEFKYNMTKKKFILYSLIGFVILLIYFQYKYERAIRNPTGMEDTDENFYEILGVEPNSDLSTIRKNYKDLAKLWHPDKHHDCKVCKEKFAQITKAYEVLTDVTKRGEYEVKSGRSVFSSQPVVLTEKNYHRLVEESNDFWVIIVYENRKNDRHLQYIANAWDDVCAKYKNSIKFGSIDILTQENLLNFLPFKFPIIPSIFTHLHGEGNELLHKIDYFSPIIFTEFIERSFPLKVKILDQGGIIKFSEKVNNQVIDISNREIKMEDLDLNFFILSQKNLVHIVSKDFAKNYIEYATVFQNDFGLFDHSSKTLNALPTHRLFISYNALDSVEDNKLYTTIAPIPLPVSVNVKTNENEAAKLQTGFNVGKSLIVPKIYRNNYMKHCINKIHLHGEEFEEKNENETKISICIIELKSNRFQGDNALSKGFYYSVIENFKKNLQKLSIPKKKKAKETEEYDIEINFGYAELEKNREILNLYEKYIKEKEIKEESFTSKSSKLFMIINHTNEKFIFKWFQNPQVLIEFFGNLDNSDYFEDIGFGFDYFGDYEVKDISKLFNEQKIFSIVGILLKSVYAQVQPSHLAGYIVYILILVHVFKKNDVTQVLYYISYAFSGSVSLHFIWNVIVSIYF